MKVKKTSSGKVSMKLSYSNYTGFCLLIRRIQIEKNEDISTIIENDEDILWRLEFLVLTRLLNRLSKADYWPLNSHYLEKDTVTIKLEMEEILVIYRNIPGLNGDPLISFLNIELHKIIIN